MRLTVFFFSLLLGIATGCSSSSDPSAPCAMTVVMSCSDGSSCHEFYSQKAADEVRSDCVSLGQTISKDPCSKIFPDCCVMQRGSNSNPEGQCLAPGQWSGGNTCTG